jgi:CheY-like chemotaxis protein/anti-sigma regulatory factor (Ser/Thr protein kinase)
VALSFDCQEPDFTLETDRSKLAQILRNLVSNALKFTVNGTVRVRIRQTDDGRAELSVTDTGVGIPADHVDRVFEEFTQIENPLQEQVKGTGLGLPIVRRLTEILGGEVSVESTVGEGSTFTVAVPLVHPDAVEMRRVEVQSEQRDPSRAPVLVVEDDRRSLFVYERYLSNAGFQVIPARTVDAARRALERELPVAIVLDVVLEEENTWNFLADVKRDWRTQHVPVLVVTVSEKGEAARALGADEFWLKPIDQGRLLRKLQALVTKERPVKVLVVDDDERARYLMRKHVSGSQYELHEAASGEAGVALAQEIRPDVIFLDFLLENMTAFDVLDELKSNPDTRAIPVIIVTSQVLDASARQRLSLNTEAVISKQNLSRELAINRSRDALRKGGTETRL